MPEISDKYVPFIRAQLRKLIRAAAGEPISVERMAQDFLGAIMQKTAHCEILSQEASFDGFKAAMLSPAMPERDGAVMYVHGGGYCCGDIGYAKGFGTMLASEAMVRVFCPAYRLAPEYPFPAALVDAMACYRYLLKTFSPDKIVLTGESAGGGLIYSMCMQAKLEGLPMPGGLIAMSPWTDLSCSGASFEKNEDIDPSLTRSRLQMFASCYSSELANPLVSPLFGDLSGLPESLIFVGGDEILLDDAAVMHKNLLAAGCKSRLTVAPEMWHAYVLYGLKERRQDMDDIVEFVRRVTA